MDELLKAIKQKIAEMKNAKKSTSMSIF